MVYKTRNLSFETYPPFCADASSNTSIFRPITSLT